MPRIPANLHEVKEIEALPSGVYSVRIESMPQLTQSKEKKTDGIELQLTFLDPGTEINGSTPRKMKHTLWKSANQGWAYFKIKEACDAFGVQYDDEGFDSDDFLNTEAKVTIEQSVGKTKQGEEYIRNEVGKFLKP